MIESDLETPAVVVDRTRLERNVTVMAAAATRANVRLRPHAKTHKCPEIARLQLACGAGGLTVAKIGEAEIFAEEGADDLFIAYPVVGAVKAARVLALMTRVRMIVGIDSIDGARSLSDVIGPSGRRLDVRIEVDTGLRRTGVLPEQVEPLARVVADLPGLRLQGLFTHAGQAYAEPAREGITAVGRHEGRTLVECAETLRRAGLEIDDVSVGSTPTALDAMAVPGVTECRPGTYVFNDATQVALGVCPADHVALSVLATVVSVPAPDRVVVDAGSKTLSSDVMRPAADTYGVIENGRGRIVRLTEEHGVVEPAPGAAFRVGDRVRILPAHVCPVVNLHDRLVAVRDGRVEGELHVAARGRVR